MDDTGMATNTGIIIAAAAASSRSAVSVLGKPPPRSSERNRRQGSNKQEPVVISHECPSVMRAHVLEVPAGRDVLSCVAQFARRVRRGALVLGAAGRVTDVVLPALVLRGTAEILSLAGCFFPTTTATTSAGTAVLLAGPRGTVLGGVVEVGGLVAAGPVVVTVATFVAAALDRLPLELPGGKGSRGCADVHGRRQPQKLCGWARKHNIGLERQQHLS